MSLLEEIKLALHYTRRSRAPFCLRWKVTEKAWNDHCADRECELRFARAIREAVSLGQSGFARVGGFGFAGEMREPALLAGRCKRGEAKKDPDHIGRSRCADSITCSRSQERGAAQFDAPLYLPPRYFKIPSSKARMRTVATRSRATSSPGASSLPASVS